MLMQKNIIATAKIIAENHGKKLWKIIIKLWCLHCLDDFYLLDLIVKSHQEFNGEVFRDSIEFRNRIAYISCYCIPSFSTCVSTSVSTSVSTIPSAIDMLKIANITAPRTILMIFVHVIQNTAHEQHLYVINNSPQYHDVFFKVLHLIDSGKNTEILSNFHYIFKLFPEISVIRKCISIAHSLSKITVKRHELNAEIIRNVANINITYARLGIEK